MAETKEFKGQWWLPGKEEDKVSGTLYYTPGELLLLELIGNFRDEAQDPFYELLNIHRIDTIFGQCPDGKDITLFDAGCNLQRAFKADYPVARYHPRKIAIGMHLSSLEDKVFFKAVVRIPELSYWLHPNMLIKESIKDDDGNQCINVRMNKLSEKETIANRVIIGSDYRFTLVPSANYYGSNLLLEASFRQETLLQIEKPGNASFKAFYQKAIGYERFLSLAVLREVYYSELTLYSEQSIKTTLGDKIVYNPVVIDTIFHEAPSTKTIEAHTFLFRYQDIQSEYKAILKKWFSVDKNFDAIRGHFLESLDYHGSFSYINFLVVIQAVEGYARRYMSEEAKVVKIANNHGKITLNDYLTTILSAFRDVRKVNQRIDTRAIIDTRDYHSHLLEKQKKRNVDGEKLYDLTNELRRILVCCIMSYVGFKKEDIDKFSWETYNPIFADR